MTCCPARVLNQIVRLPCRTTRMIPRVFMSWCSLHRHSRFASVVHPPADGLAWLNGTMWSSSHLSAGTAQPVGRHPLQLRLGPDCFLRRTCCDQACHPTCAPTHHHPPRRIHEVTIVGCIRLERHQMPVQFLGEGVVTQQHCVFGEHTVQIHQGVPITAGSAVIQRLELLDAQLATGKRVRQRRQMVEQSPAPQQMVGLPGGTSPGDRDLARSRPSAALVVVARNVPVVLETVMQPLSPRPIHLANPRLHPRQQL